MMQTIRKVISMTGLLWRAVLRMRLEPIRTPTTSERKVQPLARRFHDMFSEQLRHTEPNTECMCALSDGKWAGIFSAVILFIM